tara:strand:+ start:566 stop:1291 length:726 start_codon:yes stop_codon:yes gene_type:complete
MIELKHFSSFFIANWKLNGSFDFIDNFINNLSTGKSTKNCITLCVPYVYLSYVSGRRTTFNIGAQDCSIFESGAYTGEISAKMLRELEIDFCIIGHSERRQYFNETNEIVKQKAIKLIENSIVPIICIGESLNDKEKGNTHEVLGNQIENSIPEISNELNTIIAYEPIWAIGTGLTPSIEEIDVSHKFIRNLTSKYNNYKIVYGGSVNAKNSKLISEIEGVNGSLIGGCSLKIEEFNQIIS